MFHCFGMAQAVLRHRVVKGEDYQDELDGVICMLGKLARKMEARGGGLARIRVMRKRKA